MGEGACGCARCEGEFPLPCKGRGQGEGRDAWDGLRRPHAPVASVLVSRVFHRLEPVSHSTVQDLAIAKLHVEF